VDLYPTFLELAAAKPPADYPLDGTSYLSFLTGNGKGATVRKPLFWHFPGYLGSGGGTWRTTPAGAIRVGDWKLQEFFEDGRLELYNLREDIGQQKNLASAQPAKAKELHEKLLAWRKEIKAPMPTPNLNTEKPSAETDASPSKKGKRGGKAKSETRNPKPE
jgi:arylsulfatase A-like enzyme